MVFLHANDGVARELASIEKALEGLSGLEGACVEGEDIRICMWLHGSWGCVGTVGAGGGLRLGAILVWLLGGALASALSPPFADPVGASAPLASFGLGWAAAAVVGGPGTGSGAGGIPGAVSW